LYWTAGIRRNALGGGMQAFGEDGAQQLKQGLYDAQKQGQTALTKQTIAKYVGGGIVATLGLGKLAHLAGALIP
jgi:hypothetical protein